MRALRTVLTFACLLLFGLPPVAVAEYAIVTGGSVEFRRTPWQNEY